MKNSWIAAAVILLAACRSAPPAPEETGAPQKVAPSAPKESLYARQMEKLANDKEFLRKLAPALLVECRKLVDTEAMLGRQVSPLAFRTVYQQAIDDLPVLKSLRDRYSRILVETYKDSTTFLVLITFRPRGPSSAGDPFPPTILVEEWTKEPPLLLRPLLLRPSYEKLGPGVWFRLAPSRKELEPRAESF